MGQDVVGRREAGKLDCFSELGRARQLDEGDVVAGEKGRVTELGPLARPSLTTQPLLQIFHLQAAPAFSLGPFSSLLTLDLHKCPQLLLQWSSHFSCIRITRTSC